MVRRRMEERCESMMAVGKLRGRGEEECEIRNGGKNVVEEKVTDEEEEAVFRSCAEWEEENKDEEVLVMRVTEEETKEFGGEMFGNGLRERANEER